MKKILIAFISFVMFSSCCDKNNGPAPDFSGCEVNWEKYHGNPVLEPGSSGEWDNEFVIPGPVLYFDGKYHMWYTGGILSEEQLRVGHATSTDGLVWTKDINNPVLDVGPDGSWDDASVGAATVLLIDNVFHMWYGGEDTTVNWQIGHATSTDGVNWEKDVNNPVLEKGPEGSWDDNWVLGGTVLKDGDKYHLWYYAHMKNTGSIRCGHATSQDGVAWTKDPQNPVLSHDHGAWDSPRIDMPSVLFDGTTYHMWYSGGAYFSWQTGYAKSEDGSVWTKYTGNPVLTKGSPGNWDAKSVGFCTVLDSAGIKYKMWYCGSTEEDRGSIGYAESDICTSASK